MNPPVPHFDEAVAALGECPIMRRHHECHSFGSNYIQQKLEHFGAGVFVERPRGLICEQNARPVHQSPAERGALTFSARQLLNSLVKSMAKTRKVSELPQAHPSGLPLGARSDRRDKTVLLKRQIRNEVMQLKDKTHLVPKELQRITMSMDLNAIHGDHSLVRCVQPPKEMEQSTLAATRRSA
jgi:hypothetical protein